MQNAQKRQQMQMETTLNDITTQCHICRTNKQTKHRNASATANVTTFQHRPQSTN